MPSSFSSLFRTLAPGAVVAMAMGGTVDTSRAELPPLIPREVLFGNPEKQSPKLAPDGKRLAWLAPDAKNVLQVWVKTVGKDDEKIVTADKKRGIRQYEWAENSKDLLYLQDADGDENWHIYGVNLETGQVRDLTPEKGVQARITATNPDFPDEVLISLNLRDKRLHDVYRLNLKNGELKPDTENPGDVAAFEADPKFQIRAAQVMTPDGGTEIRIRDDVKSEWKTWLTVGPEENLGFIDFTADGKSAFLLSSIGSDTARILERNIITGQERVIAASDEVDAGQAMVHPTKHVVQAVAFAPGRMKWTVVDPSVKGDLDGIAQLNDGDFQVINRDKEDATWLVAFTSDRGPIRYYTWDRAAKKGTFLFVHQPKLEGLALAPMKSVVIKTRDGLNMHAYLTLPVGSATKNLPLVLFAHGGPWGRDAWGFNPSAQWFANRGYACLMVNYRGSTGY